MDWSGRIVAVKEVGEGGAEDQWRKAVETVTFYGYFSSDIVTRPKYHQTIDIASKT